MAKKDVRRRRLLAPRREDRGDAHVLAFQAEVSKALMEEFDSFRPEIRSVGHDYAVRTKDLREMRNLPENVVRRACERAAKAQQTILWGCEDVLPGSGYVVRRRR